MVMDSTPLARLNQVVSALEQTPTGIGLLNRVVVVPITDTPRTDTAGVPDGALNYYRDGGSLWQQVFSFEDQQWFQVEMSPP